MSEDYIAATKYWLKEVIIGHNFCPFAKDVFAGDAIRYVCLEVSDFAVLSKEIMAECVYLDDHPETATCLCILQNAGSDFSRFLDLVAMANESLCAEVYEGVYQLAHFHPDYCFEGEHETDASNYTNRSPYPIIHLLREESIDDALLQYRNPEQIPQRNIEHARKQGAAYFKGILKTSKEQ